MKDTINYTAQDIERYYNGGLSPAQMNALEKAALDDPFLADALEGYVFTKTPSDDIISLQQKLADRIKDEQRNPFFAGPQWMKIAALFILIAGGGWLIIQSLSSSFKNEVAVSIPSVKQQAPATQQINADSVPVLSDAPVSNETVAITRTPANPSARKQDNATGKIAVGKPASDAGALSLAAKQDTNMSTAIGSDNLTGYEKNKIDSEVGSAMKKEASMGRSSSNDTIRNVDVVLQKSERALEEVVVNPKAKRAAAKPRKMIMLVDTLEPANGWGYFDDYIASNIKSPGELKIKPVSGEVELSFDVNKEGEPVNIAVTKSLCDRCDKEAIRLLREGPKWKNQANKGKVKIRFTSP